MSKTESQSVSKKSKSPSIETTGTLLKAAILDVAGSSSGTGEADIAPSTNIHTEQTTTKLAPTELLETPSRAVPAVKQSNRCTVCIENRKYCDGEPICSECRTYYIAYDLPQRYCSYPFIPKGKNPRTIKPADIVPTAALSLSGTTKKPFEASKFWRPSTDEDFPILIKEVVPKIEDDVTTVDLVRRPRRKKRSVGSFKIEDSSELDEDEVLLSTRKRRKTPLKT